MKNKINLLAILALAAFFLSCRTENKKELDTPKNIEVVKEEHKEEHKKEQKGDCKDVHWSHHQGKEGPENWKNLCTGFSDCAGKSQSPINIETKIVSNDNNLTAPNFSYDKSKVDIVNNGHTVQFNITGDNTVNLNGKDYKLLQFHYHAKSEHTIDGEHYPLEVHFVHQHSATSYAVLGVMFKEGAENALFTKYLDKFPKSKGEFKSEDTIEILNLLPKNKSYFNYSGSLTTPPCSEVVNWYLLKTPLTASKEQILEFSKILDNNYRPIMPLNDRKISAFSSK